MILKKTIGLVAISLLASLQTEAITVGFGPIPGAAADAYGGSGIPQNTSTWAQFDGIQGDLVTLSLAGTQYRDNPALANNGVNTYFAATGAGIGGVRSPWNFDYYWRSDNGFATPYTFRLTIKNQLNGMSFAFDPEAVPDNSGVVGFYAGNSESLDFAALGGPIGYDKNLAATYELTLDALFGERPLGSVKSYVVTGSGGSKVPDGGATGFMLCAGLAGLAAVRRKVL
jgi:hypothetical protein